VTVRWLGKEQVRRAGIWNACNPLKLTCEAPTKVAANGVLVAVVHGMQGVAFICGVRMYSCMYVCVCMCMYVYVCMRTCALLSTAGTLHSCKVHAETTQSLKLFAE
jgi:hypothetical protein